MDQNTLSTDLRLARLEGQYHALSQELTAKFQDLQNVLEKVQKQVEEINTVKGGMLRSQNLSDVVKRIDGEVQEMHKQVIAISNALQVKR